MNKPINPWKVTGYKAGQNVACKVIAAEPGGYAVIITKDNLPGFLPTEHKLRVGEEVLAQFVCVHNNRVLLSSRLSNTQLATSTYKPGQQVSWEQELKEQASSVPNSESEAAFRVWAQTQPGNIKLRRAIDLILPPIDNQPLSQFKIGDYDLLWLITDLEGGMRTGCVKAFCEERKSRSAMLLYRGRAVGCIYTSKKVVDPQPTEYSLQLMLTDLRVPNTILHIYDLPEEVTVSMSALFLGYPVERSDDLDTLAYMNHILGWLKQREQTACLAFSFPVSASTCLGFIYKGHYIGSFYVENQQFSKDISFIHDLISQDSQARVEASILPPEITSSSVCFGFSLSMAMPRDSES